jgi:Thymidylate synthase
MGDPGERMIFHPLYYGDRLTIVNPAGDIGLVTLWSPAYALRRHLERVSPGILDPHTSRIAVISNLYGDGLYHMLCNLLYNPQIRHLIAIGVDLGLPTITEIEAFIEHGLEKTIVLGMPVCRIPGTTRFFPSLERFDVERLQNRLNFTYLGRLASDEAAHGLAGYVASLPQYRIPTADERVRVEIPPAPTDEYSYRPSDIAGHQVMRRRPLDCWEELVARTIRFGHPVQLDHGPRLELLNAKAIIGEPADDPADSLQNYGFSLEFLHRYQEKILDSEIPPDISYTYGNRLRRHFRRDEKEIDTLEYVIKILQDNPESRHAYVSLWDNSIDLPADGRHSSSATPCLVTLFFRRSQCRLTLTATYRSQNLLTAWLQNVYGLMAIQQRVCRHTGMPPGPITVVSHSLGIDPRSPRYEVAQGISRRWTRDEDVDRITGRHVLREDPNGYFVVRVDNNEIVVDHRYEGILLKQYRSSNAAKIEREIAGDMAVSLVSHALWLGRELRTKAEILRLQREHRTDASTDETL